MHLFFDKHSSWVTKMRLAAEAATVLGCIFYSVVGNRRQVHIAIVVSVVVGMRWSGEPAPLQVSTVLAAATILLELPLVDVQNVETDSVDLGALGQVSPFGYAMCSGVFSAFVGQLAFMPLEVVFLTLFE